MSLPVEICWPTIARCKWRRRHCRRRSRTRISAGLRSRRTVRRSSSRVISVFYFCTGWKLEGRRRPHYRSSEKTRVGQVLGDLCWLKLKTLWNMRRIARIKNKIQLNPTIGSAGFSTFLYVLKIINYYLGTRRTKTNVQFNFIS